MSNSSRWPSSLLLIRHGESAGNVARDFAEANGEQLIDIAVRDMDVPLSERGARQASALGHWIATIPTPPEVVYSSPYVRATSTAELAVAAAHVDAPLILDERLREREFGVLDRLTKLGIETRHPEQAEARARVGKFYYRPPGGESWCDVALRVRSLLDTISREHSGSHVAVVCHEVVVFMFRYVLERLTEHDVLSLNQQHALANCSVTSFAFEDDAPSGRMVLDRFNEVQALDEADAPVTIEPDVPRAPR